MSVPYWVQDAIIYQIFPDRFANGDPENDPPNIQAWDSKPTVRGFHGGDLRGVIQKFDYLLDLGINCIYFNPIFESASNHRYHTNDYYKIDPMVGTTADFRALLDVAHANGVRVLLDGVFNHSGRGFFAFNNILENREYSPYTEWYHINRFPVDAFSDGRAEDYEAWWGLKGLPKFNTDNPRVREYIMDVARYWIKQGIDGWRLDVPAEIDDDDFWAEFRRVVKKANPDAYLVGEIWEVNPRWLDESHFDGLMNYPLRDALLDLLAYGHAVTDFANQVEDLLEAYPREHVYAQYLPLGSHDTRRLMTKLNGEVDKVRLAFTFQFAYPGAPAIYYGDEIGLEGEKDPDCRGAFPWDEGAWDKELRAHVQKLIALRKGRASLRRGDYQRVVVNEELGYYAFTRALGEDRVLVVINAGEKVRQVNLPVMAVGWADGERVKDLLGRGHYEVKDGGLELTLPAWGAVVVGSNI